MFWIGLMAGTVVGVCALALVSCNRKYPEGEGSIDDCDACKKEFCKDCRFIETRDKKIADLEYALIRERGRHGAWKREANRMQGLLWMEKQANREGVAR